MGRSQVNTSASEGRTESEQESINRKVIENMVKGFATQDIELIMRQFADNGVYYDMHGAGINGKQYSGKKDIRRIFERYFRIMPSHTYDDAKILISGDQAHANWNLVIGDRGKKKPAYRTRGSDYFELENGKIITKNAWIMNTNTLRWVVLKERAKEVLASGITFKGLPSNI